jgi:hypothetical protein
VFESWYRARDEHQITVTGLVGYTGKMSPTDNFHCEYEGTSVNFKFNIYSADKTNAEELKRDNRDFAIPALAAKRMLEAAGDPSKRGEYSIDILEMIKERVSNEKKSEIVPKFYS